MFNLSVPWWELAVRSVAVYAFLLILLRLTGKRQVGQLAPMDLILLLILSNAVQNSMNAGDNSLVGGLISATALVLINWLLSYASFRSATIETVVDGIPLVLVRDGQIQQQTLDEEHITRAELDTGLRLSGSFDINDVQLAMLESNGHISVWTKAERPADAEAASA